MSSHISHHEYRRLLERWIPYAAKDLYTPPDRPDLLVYGTGESNWGAQTHAKAFSAFAVLATDPDLDAATAGASRDELLDQSLRMLRYMLQSHIDGDYGCLDNRRWGHTWISILGPERMMHAVEALEPHLTEADQELLRKILVSESDWLLDHYPVTSGLLENNHPESNLWNGAVLHRIAMMYPDNPRAAAYREKGTKFLLNSISVPEDAECETVIDGRPVREWFVGEANFFSSMATNHHRYLNVGYKVICLSNLAMLHFSFKRRGIPAPKALYWHLDRLWDLLRQLTFPDGRLLRVGGDTRVRYCYCQDYAIPMWLLMADLQRDPVCPTFEFGWLEQVRTEMENNGDGSFLSDRCAPLRRNSPTYHTRLESDRANTLSFGAYWRRLYGLLDEVKPESTHRTHPMSWRDDYHGACVEIGEKRTASFTWRAGELPTGLVLPTGESHLAEWRYNLAGEVKGLGRKNHQEVVSHQERFFEGGFLTWGQTNFVSEEFLAEGSFKETLAANQLVFAALPDDATVIVIQRATAVMRAFLQSVKGTFWQIPNDLWNGYKRQLHLHGCSWVVDGKSQSDQHQLLSFDLVNVDNKLGLQRLFGEEGLSAFQPAQRQIGLRYRDSRDPFASGGMLRAIEICSPCRLERHSVDKGTVLYHNAFAMRVATAPETAAYLREQTDLTCTCRTPNVDAVAVRGADGQLYLLVANLSNTQVEAELELPHPGTLSELGTEEQLEIEPDRKIKIDLDTAAARLFKWSK